jgi:hypothetical protein
MLSPKFYKNFLAACKDLRTTSGSVHSAAGAFEMLQIMDNSVYRPEWFKVYELVDPLTFNRYGDKSLQFMDSRMLWTLDAMREYFNRPIVVNNYMTAKPGVYVYKFSGLRLPDSLDNDADRSQHIYGRAGDLKVFELSAEEVRQEIKAKWKTEPAFRFITAIEDKVNWLHIDCRNTNSEQLLVFSK